MHCSHGHTSQVPTTAHAAADLSGPAIRTRRLPRALLWCKTPPQASHVAFYTCMGVACPTGATAHLLSCTAVLPTLTPRGAAFRHCIGRRAAAPIASPLPPSFRMDITTWGPRWQVRTKR